MSERRVRLCGYTIAAVMEAVNLIDSALETVYDYVLGGMRQAARDYVYTVEQHINEALFALELARRICGTTPDAGRTFREIAEELRGKLETVRADPRKAREYRGYRFRLKDAVKAFLSD